MIISTNISDEDTNVFDPPQKANLSLFWRTFVLLALVIVVSSLAWLQMFRTKEAELRMMRSADRIARAVNVTQTALNEPNHHLRTAWLKMLADQDGVNVSIRQLKDKFVTFKQYGTEGQLTDQVVARLGAGTLMAAQVNGEPGFWVGFKIEQDMYWLQMNSSQLLPGNEESWLNWLTITLALSLGGAAMMTGVINQPLKRISFAASQLREGQFTTTNLDEKAVTREIREVNIDFNRLAERLAKIEQERALMLAGISHDLRTPLARLRLETELSVTNLETRDLMSADIAQLDDIIDKFLDYARPEPTALGPVLLSSAISRSIAPWRNSARFEIQLDVAEDLQVQAESVELVRVLSNLLENARRYGQSPSDGVTRVEIVARLHDGWILLRVRDHGQGVTEATLKNLTQPFFRGDEARTSATGSGLGLAIVERSVQRMGGTFSVFNASGGGLMALMKFKEVPNED